MSAEVNGISQPPLQRNAARRSTVIGFRGAVATSQPLAAQAGLRVLQAGGNAVDAAIAAGAALNVVEPMSTGMGGDVFALVYRASDRRVYALNGSGRAPAKATPELFQQRGLQAIPQRGILPVTVPGAPAAWADLSARFGRLGLAASLEPAIAYAMEGYPVSEYIASLWQRARPLLERDPESTRVFLPDGRPPRTGERMYLPDLGRSLRRIASEGAAAFYQGEIAQAIEATSQAHDGLLTAADLAAHTSTWEEPISSVYRGHRVWECPPNGQGIATLLALNVLEGYPLAEMQWADPLTVHLKMEAVKLAMIDAARYVADPAMAEVPVDALLSAAYAQERRAAIRPERALAAPGPWQLPTSHDTVYVTAADGEGNACSFINSLYMGFGSGITVPGTGVVLQNRGHLFTLDRAHPNCLAPGKRPYHTIIPAMVTRDEALALCYGVMGGFMQPQGQVQVLCNILDHGMSPQEALDAPRFCYESDGSFHIEPYFGMETLQQLQRFGHRLEVEAGYYGGGQVIRVHPESGALMAGSEPRNDGAAVAF
ncbi:MAG: gamma-glutamyltransferase [Anaerolineae bacterium]|nr:gamma-glutamyltransferase [Chloroflexota bacterium]